MGLAAATIAVASVRARAISSSACTCAAAMTAPRACRRCSIRAPIRSFSAASDADDSSVSTFASTAEISCNVERNCSVRRANSARGESIGAPVRGMSLNIVHRVFGRRIVAAHRCREAFRFGDDLVDLCVGRRLQVLECVVVFTLELCQRGSRRSDCVP